MDIDGQLESGEIEREEDLPTCARCHQRSRDLRTLWMACLYEMGELGIPLVQTHVELAQGDPRIARRTFYTLRVCKDCRASWMQAIKAWFKHPWGG